MGEFKRLDNVGFFRLCEELRNRREVLLRDRPSCRACCKEMSERLKLSVCHDSLKRAMEATGIIWQPQKKAPADKAERYSRQRIVVKAVVRLYRKLGEEPPSELVQLLQLLDGKTPSVSEAANGTSAH